MAGVPARLPLCLGTPALLQHGHIRSLQVLVVITIIIIIYRNSVIRRNRKWKMDMVQWLLSPHTMNSASCSWHTCTDTPTVTN